MRKVTLAALALLSLMALSGISRGGKGAPCTITDMYLAGVPAEEVRHTLVVPRDWLEDGELVIEGEAPQAAEKIEVTLDGGKTWHTAKGTTSWYYSFQPLPRERFKIGARAWCQGRPATLYRKKFYNVSFTGKTAREIVTGRLQAMALFYQGKNRLQFMKLFSRWLRSPLYSNYRDLEVQVRNDFQWGGTIQYRFYLDQALKNGSTYIARTHWYLTYLGLMEPKEGYTEFHFDSGDRWKVTDIRGDKPFGIIEEPKPDLYIGEDEIQGEFPVGYPTGTLMVPIHNRGRIAARRVVVKVHCKGMGGFAGAGQAEDTETTVIKVVPIMGTRVATLILTATGGNLEWFPPVTCNIAVDPQNRISELDEGNNRSQKTFGP